MGGKLAADLLHRLFAILVVQVAPAGAVADVALFDFAGPL